MKAQVSFNRLELIQKCFDKLWAVNACWAASVFDDALIFARSAEPRCEEILSRGLDSTKGSSSGSATPLKQDEISSLFVQNVWPSLKSRGWKASVLSEGPHAGKTQYAYEGKQVSNIFWRYPLLKQFVLPKERALLYLFVSHFFI